MEERNKLKHPNSDRIKLPFNFDVDKIQQEIKGFNLADFEYYNVVQLRAPAHLVDTSLPFPPPADDYADGSWTNWLDTSQLKKSPYLNSIINIFKQHTNVTLVRLLRLAPGSIVKEHTDPTLALDVHSSVIRLTIPIITNDQVTFFLSGTPVDMKLGECWYLKLNDPHKIDNLGDTERINLSIDIIPNEWVKKMVENSLL